MYRVVYRSRRVEKELDEIHLEHQDQILKTLILLVNNPRLPGKYRKVRGSDGAYRVRVGDYRIIYEIDDIAEKVVILAIRKRDESTYQL